MSEFSLLKELEKIVEMNDLKEGKKSKFGKLNANKDDLPKARNFVAKNAGLAGRAGVQKPKKGKGSYNRQQSKKVDY